MAKMELNFLPHDPTEPSQQELLLQLLYGLCGCLNNSKEEYNPYFYTSFGFPEKHLRGILKTLVNELDVPISETRIDEWIEWHRTNETWIVDEEMSAKAQKLRQIGWSVFFT